jgi:hypothetical protein
MQQTMTDFENQIDAYCSKLQELEQKMQSEYDKAVITLSGGALGLSFVFLRDVVKTSPVRYADWLLWSWIAWGVSITCILFSFMTSAYAMRKAIKQTHDKVIYIQDAGGVFNVLTLVLNITGGVLFLVGVICIVVFMNGNMP